MGKTNTRLEVARIAYREALEAARTGPSPEAWSRLFAAGKELSAASERRPRDRRARKRADAAADQDEGLE